MIRIIFLLLIVMSATAFGQTAETPKAVKFDEFEAATNGYVKMKMDYFYNELNNNPTSQGYIINYGTNREIAMREKQIRVSIQWRKYDAARITLGNGGFRAKVKTEFWLVPPGAENPEPDSNVRLFDIFEKMDYERVLAAVQNLYVELGQNPNLNGIILNFGSPKLVASRERRLKEFIKYLKLDLSRVIFKAGGYEKAGKTEIWTIPAAEKNVPKTKIYIVPPGAKPPTP